MLLFAIRNTETKDKMFCQLHWRSDKNNTAQHCTATTEKIHTFSLIFLN